MNALFENFKFNNSSYTLESYAKLYSKDFPLNSSQINNPNIKEINVKETYIYLNSNENMDKIVQLMNELNYKYFKERQLKKVMDTNSKNNKMINSHEYQKNENKSKCTVDSFSEVKKFKTELCHSWELTGSCKYGLNVIYILIIIILNFYYSVFLLME